jgi:hypothetical protein
MDDQTRADDDPPPMQCEPAEDDREKSDAPVNDERTLEEDGYGYGV